MKKEYIKAIVRLNIWDSVKDYGIPYSVISDIANKVLLDMEHSQLTVERKDDKQP
jgi:hypothetical protein